MVRIRIAFFCLGFSGLAALVSCSDGAAGHVATQGAPFFQLDSFFRKETDRLTALAPTVTKTVARNGEQETKRVVISDWKSELALFAESDINKPAWRASYQADSATDGSIVYTSTDPTLRTQEIRIEKHADGKKIKHIAITNRNRNMLYQSEEQLDYFPDSLYEITKFQSVRFLGDSRYRIQAAFAN